MPVSWCEQFIDMLNDAPVNVWGRELEELSLQTGSRFTWIEPRRWMRDYERGLLAPVGRKNGWQLAGWAGHAMQYLLSRSRGDVDSVRDDLRQYVADQLGHDDGVLTVDDTGFIKKGATSAGVQRQYSGTAGCTENCQVGVFAAYATSRGHALVDCDLYLPRSWTDDRDRCRAAHIPDDRTFATKNALARDVIRRAHASPLRFRWVTADAAYGQDGRFRRFPEDDLKLHYVVAVPKSEQVHGPRIEDRIRHEAPPEAWQRLFAGPGAKGGTLL